MTYEVTIQTAKGPRTKIHQTEEAAKANVRALEHLYSIRSERDGNRFTVDATKSWTKSQLAR